MSDRLAARTAGGFTGVPPVGAWWPGAGQGLSQPPASAAPHPGGTDAVSPIRPTIWASAYGDEHSGIRRLEARWAARQAAQG